MTDNSMHARQPPPIAIRRLDPTERRCVDGDLVALAQRIQLAPPYSYRTDDVPHAEEWFTALVRDSDVVFTASTDRPVGHCIAHALDRRPQGHEIADLTGVDLATTMYIAELAVDESVRRRGLAIRLLHAAMWSCAPGPRHTSSALSLATHQRSRYTTAPGSPSSSTPTRTTGAAHAYSWRDP